MIIKSQSGTAIKEEDRLAIATLLVKLGYTVRLVTVRENGKPQKAIEYLERKKEEVMAELIVGIVIGFLDGAFIGILIASIVAGR